MTTISDALTAAEKIIAEHGIDLDNAIMAYQSMRPQLNRADARFTLRLEIASNGRYTLWMDGGRRV